MMKSESVKYLLNVVVRGDEVRRVLHVRSEINSLFRVLLADIFDFGVLRHEVIELI